LNSRRKLDSDKKTLCWKCGNAASKGCSWSDKFIPVDGWTAEYKPIKVARNRIADSYLVTACPEYIADIPLKVVMMDA
jgi:hypothetical protein